LATNRDAELTAWRRAKPNTDPHDERDARGREEPPASTTHQAKGSGRRRHHGMRSRLESHVSVLWRCKVRCTDPGVLGVLGVLRAACFVGYLV
jgi:hypothetical protein